MDSSKYTSPLLLAPLANRWTYASYVASKPKAPEKPKQHRPSKAEMEERVSLYPLDPEEALAALLKVDPNSEPVKDPRK